VHGSIKTRGSEIAGVVVSAKARKTVIIERPYTIFLKKYERYARKNSRIAAHNPECMDAKEGDHVTIAETRRISRTKSFVVTKVERKKAA
jgi:small subunit ribosomal protein S17